MALFKYKRKETVTFTLPETGDHILVERDQPYELPEENDYIKTLEQTGYLEKVPIPRKKKEPK